MIRRTEIHNAGTRCAKQEYINHLPIPQLLTSQDMGSLFIH